MKDHRTITLQFVRETDLARLYRDKKGREHWVPRTVVRRTLKWPDGRHEVEMESWKAEELGL